MKKPTPRLIYCAAGNKRFSEIAIRHGFAYGAQLPNTIYYAPGFCDQNWRKPDRAKYMAALAEHRPALATVLDYEREAQLGEVLSWAHEAAQYVKEAVIIIPKAQNTLAALPREIGGKEVRLGYSVPTRFGGTEVPVWEFCGWPVHLLGGAPQAQMKLAAYLDNVQSADGNYAMKMANQHNAFFVYNKMARYAKNSSWPKLNECGGEWIKHDVPYKAFELSCINIQAAWNGCPSSVRYANESDLAAIKKIGNQYKSELGYVMYPALREAIARYELYVAFVGAEIVGFIHFRTRRDGWRTVYELATHRDWQKRGIGRMLLSAVPAPVRLKCTVDNVAANDFYEATGMKPFRCEEGRKRKLNVWESSAPTRNIQEQLTTKGKLT